jgi:hypothetical protein
MNHKTLAQKRTRKALARKNKKYTGPKYSKLEQMLMWQPLLAKVGINMFAEVSKGYNHDQSNQGSTTSFV